MPSFTQTKPLQFEKACIRGKSVVLAAVGDVLLHYPLQLKASQTGFKSLWEEAIPFLKSADVVYGNLEGPVAEGLDGGLRKTENGKAWNFKVYSTYPLFNYHPTLPGELRDSGFTIVSTANNHALDRSSIGIDKTLDALDQSGLLHVGSVRKGDPRQFTRIVEIQGVKIAFISCTEHNNGNADKYHQVLTCFSAQDRAFILDTVKSLKSSVDVIVVAPHFGDEYKPKPNAQQVGFAHAVLEAGATALIGAHPHVLEPVEIYRTKDGRETLVSYSLGNFVSNQSAVATKSSILLLVGLTKTASETIINGIRYVPIFMENHVGTDKLRLRLLKDDKKDDGARAIIEAAIDKQRALRSLPIVTNPECVQP